MRSGPRNSVGLLGFTTGLLLVFIVITAQGWYGNEPRPQGRVSAGTPGAYLPLVRRSFITPSATPDYPYGRLLISEIAYDAQVGEPEGEWLELYNAGTGVIDLSAYKIGDAEFPGDDAEGMLRFPPGSTCAPGQVVIIANQASVFRGLFGINPDYELQDSDPSIPDMEKYLPWSGGNLSLSNGGDEVQLLDGFDLQIDVLGWGESPFAFDPPLPIVAQGHSVERYPASQDTDSASDWVGQPAPNPGTVRLVLPPSSTPSQTMTATGTPTPTPTVTRTPTPTPTPTAFMGLLYVSEVLYDPAGNEPEEEWIELYNAGADAINLDDFKLGDEEVHGGPEGMLRFPAGASIPSGGFVVVARNGIAFEDRYGFPPDFEVIDSGSTAPEMIAYIDWGSVNLALGNPGDEVLLLDGLDQVIDAISYGDSNWAFDPPCPVVTEGHSLERYPPGEDTDSALDWRNQASPSPGQTPSP